MLPSLLPMHRGIGKCTAPGSGCDVAERARTVKEAVKSYPTRTVSEAEERKRECTREWKRQKLAAHLTSGGTASNYGPNVKPRQKRADHLTSGGTTFDYGPNRAARQKNMEEMREKMLAVQQQLHSTTTDLFNRVLSRLEDIPKTTDKCTDGLMDADTPTLGMLLVPLTSPPEVPLKEDWRNFKHAEGQEDKMRDAFAVVNRLHLTYWG